MKLLGIVIQKKLSGQNILIASAPSLPTKSCVVYSHMIYNYVRKLYDNKQRIQRTINIEGNLICTVNVTKDYILYIFSAKSDISLAFDGIRKITEYFNRPGNTATARMQAIPKKLTEYMSILQEFLTTREISFKESIPMQPQAHSKKKTVDYEIFNKFSHLSNENDKKVIFETQNASGKIEANEMRKKIKIIENAEKFQIKSQDEIFSLDIDSDKEKFIQIYRRNICKMGLGKKARQNEFISPKTTQLYSDISESKIENDFTLEYIEDTFIEKEKEKIRLKIKEKLTLSLQHEKVKEVNQLGQIFIEGTQAETAKLILKEQALWKNVKVVGKRISPNSLECTSLSDTEYEFKTVEGYKSKAIIDYVLRTQTFNPQKIPLLFIYTMQVNSTNIEFTFKYKMNEKWKHKIFDFDINVYLNKQFIVLDCKSIPAANSLKNNKVTWKTKQITPNSHNSKGKILLAFGQAKFPPKKIISEIRLNMKSNCGLIQNLSAECQQEWGNISEAERTLFIEYKIAPN